MTRLTPEEIAIALNGLPDWTMTGNSLCRDYKFADFVAAMAFVNRLAGLAEQAGHHPDIDIRYNKVRVGLVTHDAGGVTANDIQMAAKISAMAAA